MNINLVDVDDINTLLITFHKVLHNHIENTCDAIRRVESQGNKINLIVAFVRSWIPKHGA